MRILWGVVVTRKIRRVCLVDQNRTRIAFSFLEVKMVVRDEHQLVKVDKKNLAQERRRGAGKQIRNIPFVPNCFREVGEVHALPSVEEKKREKVVLPQVLNT